MIAKIYISLKDGVLDPEAKAIHNALLSLNFDYVKSIKNVRTIIVDIDSNDEEIVRNKAIEMSETLLVNTTIEKYSIEILP